jgi:hypothetical protein
MAPRAHNLSAPEAPIRKRVTAPSIVRQHVIVPLAGMQHT